MNTIITIEDIDGTRRRKELKENQSTKESYLNREKYSENKNCIRVSLG